MRFPPNFLDEIRARIPISDVIGRKVTWDKRKSNPGRGDYWACCPFHGEKTPSFHAENRKGRYHCFGCGVSGDHFTFLVEQEGLSFPDAVAQLAAEAGLPLPERDPDSEKREAERASLHDIMERAAKFFEAALQSPEGSRARAYLRERGLSPETQKRFRVGYALSSRNALKEHLAAAGISQEQMIEAGLLIAGEDIPVSYDRFRDRIVFPINDNRGRVIAFGGRALSSDVPAKYLNSPETPLFHKSQVLYNAQSARAEIRKGGHVLVVEGYIDVIACVAAGFGAAVAPLGTALTEDQIALLWQMSSEPILCFDGDEAGEKAAFRVADLGRALAKSGRSLKFAFLPDGLDPDEFLRKHGPARFEEILANAKPLSEVLLMREARGVDLSIPEQRAAFEQRLYAVAASVPDKLISRHYRDYFRLKMSEMFWGSDQRRRGKEPSSTTQIRAPMNVVERIIVGLCIDQPELFREWHEEVMGLSLSSKRLMDCLEALSKLLITYDHLSVDIIYRELTPEYFDVLQEVHGAPAAEVISLQTRRQVGPKVSRGERLRLLLPVLNLQPDEDTLRDTLFYFIELHKHRRSESAMKDGVAASLEAERIGYDLKDLEAQRVLLLESEQRLDRAYERLRFRPANDNSLGQAILGDSPRPWRIALRA